MDHARIFSELSRLARDSGVPGAQLAVHDGTGTWTCEFGVEERGGRALGPDSKVPIGSISKTFTAALAMVLVSDGDLDLDTPVIEYLPELRPVAPDLAGRLTLRHLLSHTGGLPSDREPGRISSLRRHVVECFRHVDPLALPGRAFSYSNIGYVVVGHLIEAVTGMSWPEAMESVLLEPLGLGAAFTVGPLSGGRTATGHAVNPVLGQVRPVRQSLAVVDAPAGAIAASAADLVILGRLLGGTAPAGHAGLIDPALVRQMRTPVPSAEPFGVADGWGLGLAMYRDGNRVWVGHDGTADGTACHLRIEPDSGTVVALTTNGSTGFPMWHELVGRLRDLGLRIGDYRDAWAERPVAPPAERDACIGDYRNGDLEYSVRNDGQQFELAIDGESFGSLTLYDGLIFAVRDASTGENDYTGRFLRDSRRGVVDWIQVGGRLARRRGRALEVA
jgi:CubicO group peptidase (beta-lactamase class C family)